MTSTTSASVNPANPHARLSVLLPGDLEPANYAERYSEKRVPDRVPYGLENYPGDVLLSTGGPPTLIQRVVSRITGVDLSHGWRNRRLVLQSESLYCHTEREYLAAALMLLIFRRRETQLIGQTIWLFHEWPDLPRLRRLFMKRLLRRVDIFAYNAHPNFLLGRSLLPDRRHEYVPFGVSEAFSEPVASGVALSPRKRPFVLTVGNDRYRDWPAFYSLVASCPDVDFRAATMVPLESHANLDARPTSSVDELKELYATADLVVLLTSENAHASGITTLLEATAAGCAVVATDTGGLSKYFEESSVRFVPLGDAASVITEVRELLANNEERIEMSKRAQHVWNLRQYNTRGYWRRMAEVAS